jgi:hypothetical protein
MPDSRRLIRWLRRWPSWIWQSRDPPRAPKVSAQLRGPGVGDWYSYIQSVPRQRNRLPALRPPHLSFRGRSLSSILSGVARRNAQRDPASAQAGHTLGRYQFDSRATCRRNRLRRSTRSRRRLGQHPDNADTQYKGDRLEPPRYQSAPGRKLPRDCKCQRVAGCSWVSVVGVGRSARIALLNPRRPAEGHRARRRVGRRKS